MSFSFGTFFGIIGGIGLFIFSIAINPDLQDPTIFIHKTSLLMVIVGTIAATFIAYREVDVFNALYGMVDIFRRPDADSKILFADVGKIIGWGESMKKGGLSELQKIFDENEYTNPIIKYSMEMVFNGAKSDEIYKLGEGLIESVHDRKNIQVETLDTMALFSPAFGMIGTLVGLVIMLQNMEGDTSVIASGMAVALITTLYGVLFANLLFKPAARKLEQKFSITRYRDLILLEGISMLPNKPHPYIIQYQLNRYLDPTNHFDIAER